MSDETTQSTGAEDTGSTAESTPVNETPTQSATPDKYDERGVNPEWVKEMTTPPEEPAETPHETDIQPSSGRTEKSLYEIYEDAKVGLNAEAQPQQPQAFDLNGSFNAFLSKPEAGALPMLEGLYNSNQQTYTRFVDDVVLSQAEYVMGLLASRGLIPESLVPFPESYVDPAELDWMPEQYRELASTLDPDAFAELELMPDDVRDRFLEKGLDLQRYEQAEQQRQQEQFQQAGQAAWKGHIDEMSGHGEKFMQSHYEHMQANFQPFTDDAANKQAHDIVWQLTRGQALSDPNMAELLDVLGEKFEDVAVYRFHRNTQAVKQSEAAIRQLTKAFNDQYRALLDKNVKQFQAFFSHAPGARHDLPAQEQPQYIN